MSDTNAEPGGDEAVRSLEDLGGALAAEGVSDLVSDAPVYEPVIDEQGRSYATGKRKDAIARVWVKPGSGKIVIRSATKRADKGLDEYFGRPVLQLKVRQPLQLTDRETQFDIFATVSGGGLSGQAGAIRHGISVALTRYEPGPAPRAQEGRLPNARRPRRRAQEVRSGQGAQELPVLEALTRGFRPLRPSGREAEPSASRQCCKKGRLARPGPRRTSRAIPRGRLSSAPAPRLRPVLPPAPRPRRVSAPAPPRL